MGLSGEGGEEGVGRELGVGEWGEAEGEIMGLSGEGVGGGMGGEEVGGGMGGEGVGGRRGVRNIKEWG